jgi:hypothetical protein
MVSSSGYRSPPMPWSLNPAGQRSLLDRHPELAELRELRLPRGRGRFWGVLAPLLARTPLGARTRPAIVLAFAKPYGALPAGG